MNTARSGGPRVRYLPAWSQDSAGAVIYPRAGSTHASVPGLTFSGSGASPASPLPLHEFHASISPSQ